MRRWKKHGKCERCCPDGGACLLATYGDRDEAVWKCQNCHLVTPRRVVRASGEPTPSQIAVRDRLHADFGGELSWEMIGRRLFVRGINETRKWYEGQAFFGTIGPTGHYKLQLQRTGGDIAIRDRAAWNVYIQSQTDSHARETEKSAP